MNEIHNQKLGAGIFWVLHNPIDITDEMLDSSFRYFDLTDYRLLAFKAVCDNNGIIIENPAVEINKKKGAYYKHKQIWNDYIKNDPLFAPYNENEYNYYPRGNVSISNNRAEIHINPVLSYKNDIIKDIKDRFGLYKPNIHKTRVIEDDEAYNCKYDDLINEHRRKNYGKLRIQNSRFGIYAVLVSNNLTELKTNLLCNFFPDDVFDHFSANMTEEGYVLFKESISNAVKNYKEFEIKRMIKDDEPPEQIKKMREMNLVEFHTRAW